MDDVIDRYTSTPFEWGTTDCCSFVCECVQVVTGKDLSATFHWIDYASAQELIGSYGSLYDLVTHELGPPTQGYKDGDVCMTLRFGEELLGVVRGAGGVFRTERGIMQLPMASIVYVWST